MVPDERSGPVYPDFPVFHLLLPKNLHISNIFYIFALAKTYPPILRIRLITYIS